MMNQQRSKRQSAGFTLVEMIVVIVIMGIVSVGIGVFMRGPIDAFAAAKTRSEMAQNAQHAFSLAQREIRLSLPNSVRITTSGSLQFLEFVPIVSGGRYRAFASSAGDVAPVCPADDANLTDNSVLSFQSADTCFKTLGLPVGFSNAQVGDWVVVNNLGPGYANANFYEAGNATGGNKAKITAVSSAAGAGRVQMESILFGFDSAARRFQIASSPITYVCDNSSGELRRVSGYAISAAQPTPATGGSLLLRKLSLCSFSYAPATVASSFGLISIRVTQTSNGDSLPLLAQAHVSNTP